MIHLRGAEWALSKRLATFGYAALILSASYGEALAYLDAGTGSIILQAVIAGIIGTIAVGRIYWARFKEIVRRTFSADHRDDLNDR